jgi:hypothetical protein
MVVVIIADVPTRCNGGDAQAVHVDVCCKRIPRAVVFADEVDGQVVVVDEGSGCGGFRQAEAVAGVKEIGWGFWWGVGLLVLLGQCIICLSPYLYIPYYYCLSPYCSEKASITDNDLSF